MVRVLISGFIVLMSSMPGYAHGGHMGELAGHSHWLGWGMVAAAGVIIAVLGKRNKDHQNAGEEIADEENSGETAASS